ncbi:CbiX/SirB N-terminal domain-containing protein [Deinococcus sp. PESE-38]
MRSLVLIGHGSHHHGESARATQQVAEALRGRGLGGQLPYDEVLEGYWQQEPGLRQVLRTVAHSDVTVVPVFLSEGYVTETVLPRELGLGHQGPVPPGGVVRVLGAARCAIPGHSARIQAWPTRLPRRPETPCRKAPTRQT